MPSGASTGSHEARELRDGGERYGGRGVRRAVAAVNEMIAPDVAGRDAADQAGLDAALRALDGTPDLSRLGANAVLAVSVAGALAAAAAEGVPLWRAWPGPPPLLPLPMVNVISGGAHARGAGVDVQDFLVVPVGAAQLRRGDRVGGAGAPRDRRARGGSGAPRRARRRRGRARASRLPSNRDGLELLLAGIERAGLVPGEPRRRSPSTSPPPSSPPPAAIASRRRIGRSTPSAFVDELEAWCRDFPIVSLEDPLAEDDWPGWAEATRRLGDRVQLLGDDLFVTQVDRLERGIDERVANALLVKPNQCGTLTAARTALERARAAGYATVVSARSGDTEDSWLADLAVGWRAGSDQGGLDDPLGANGEVEPPAAHRGGARRGGGVRRTRRPGAVSASLSRPAARRAAARRDRAR